MKLQHLSSAALILSLFSLSQAETFQATNAGDIHDALTWGNIPEAPPSFGDDHTWSANGQKLTYSDETFFGDNPLSPPLLRSKGGFNALAPKANS